MGQGLQRGSPNKISECLASDGAEQMAMQFHLWNREQEFLKRISFSNRRIHWQ
jgi:hypothetical protein